MKENDLNILAQEWFDKAREDLGVAEHLFKERAFPSPICFHAHQAVEKFLKGVLILHGKDIEDQFKIHNLVTLYQYTHALDARINKEIKESCFILNRYYIAARYPADMPEYPWNDVKEAVEAAKKVRTLIEKIVG